MIKTDGRPTIAWLPALPGIALPEPRAYEPPPPPAPTKGVCGVPLATEPTRRGRLWRWVISSGVS